MKLALGNSLATQRIGGAAPFVGPLDAVESLGTEFHSITHRLFTSYEGPLVKIRSGGGGSPQDFGATSAGLLDVAAVLAFLNGNTGYVVEVFGQKGVFDMDQSSGAVQPVFSPTGHRGGPALQCTIAGGEYLISTGYNKTDAWCEGAAFVNAINPTAGNTGYALADLANAHAWMGLENVGGGNVYPRVYSGANLQINTDQPEDSAIVLSARVNGATSALVLGSTVQTGDAGSISAGVPATIGRSSNLMDFSLGTCWWRANGGATDANLQTINAALEALYA